MLNLDTWIVGDTHFLHKKIVQYCGRPEDWQDTLIDTWNRMIKPTDSVLHLGDFALGLKSDTREIAQQLPGRKFFIRGNHDRFSWRAYWNMGLILLVNPFRWRAPTNQIILFTHRPLWEVKDNGFLNIHGHIHGSEPSFYDPEYINASLDVLPNYAPVRLGELLEGSKQCWK